MIKWRWNDPEHIEAHRTDFLTPPEVLVDRLMKTMTPPPALSPDGFRENDKVWVHQDFKMEMDIGFSGLRTVEEAGSHSFWGYRRGRKIPSHLCLGQKEPTPWVCLWGWWEAKDEGTTLIVHTVYPGHAAPREIHDPEIRLWEIPEAIKFWKNHAIIISPEDYSETAYL